MYEDFEPEKALGIAAPCFVRKVDTMSDCGRDEQSAVHRVPEILLKVLNCDTDGCISIYFVQDSLALARIAFAINESLGRHITQDLILVPLSIEELDKIDKSQTDGDPICTFAKKCHYDLKPNETQRHELATLLASSDRLPRKLKDKRLKAIREELEKEGCRSLVVKSASCKCDDPAPALENDNGIR
jgi:hypothetical protein